MKGIAFSVTALLVASVLSGCCCCCDYQHSPVAYSDGNPYECSCCDLWGVGYYCQQYGFLCRPDACPCYTSVPAGYYDAVTEQGTTPAPIPDATVPPPAQPYDEAVAPPPAAPPAP